MEDGEVDELMERAFRLARELHRNGYSPSVLRAALVGQFDLSDEQIADVIERVRSDGAGGTDGI